MGAGHDSALTAGPEGEGDGGAIGEAALPWGHCRPTSCPWLVARSRVPEPSRLHDGAGVRPGRPAHPRQQPQVTTPRLPRDPPETPGPLSTHLPHGGACGGLRFSDRGPSLQRLGGSQWSITQLAISKMVFRELIFGESA